MLNKYYIPPSQPSDSAAKVCCYCLFQRGTQKGTASVEILVRTAQMEKRKRGENRALEKLETCKASGRGLQSPAACAWVPPPHHHSAHAQLSSLSLMKEPHHLQSLRCSQEIVFPREANEASEFPSSSGHGQATVHQRSAGTLENFMATPKSWCHTILQVHLLGPGEIGVGDGSTSSNPSAPAPWVLHPVLASGTAGACRLHPGQRGSWQSSPSSVASASMAPPSCAASCFPSSASTSCICSAGFTTGNVSSPHIS